MSDTRKYRKFTAQQKTEIVLASLRGPKSMAELCREHEIADSLLRKWREQFLAAGAERLSGPPGAHRGRRAAPPGQPARAGAGAQDDGGGGRGGTLAGMGVSMRVARSRELVAQGRPAALVARVAGISRQAIYRRPKRPPKGQRRPLDATDREVLRRRAREPDRRHADGRRARLARARRAAVNRKRVQRLMREHRLLQPKRSEGRRRRPGFFQVTRPDELWHLDMTSVWVAEHGWCYLNAAIDCCTREITGWALDVRCRAPRRPRSSTRAVAERGIRAGRADARHRQRHRVHQPRVPRPAGRARRSRIAAAAIATPRARPSSSPGSQSSSSAASGAKSSRPSTRPAPKIGAYVDGYHHRPHSGLAYRTPREVAATWKDHDDQSIPAA